MWILKPKVEAQLNEAKFFFNALSSLHHPDPYHFIKVPLAMEISGTWSFKMWACNISGPIHLFKIYWALTVPGYKVKNY